MTVRSDFDWCVALLHTLEQCCLPALTKQAGQKDGATAIGSDLKQLVDKGPHCRVEHILLAAVLVVDKVEIELAELQKQQLARPRKLFSMPLAA